MKKHFQLHISVLNMKQLSVPNDTSQHYDWMRPEKNKKVENYNQFKAITILL